MRQLGECHSVQVQVRKAWPRDVNLNMERGQRSLV